MDNIEDVQFTDTNLVDTVRIDYSDEEGGGYDWRIVPLRHLNQKSNYIYLTEFD